MNTHKHIAYFCLEFGIESQLKTYAGGLGILAGDTFKAATDEKIDFVGITLFYKDGYFNQSIDWDNMVQRESKDTFDAEKILSLTDHKICFFIGEHLVHARVWKYDYTSEISGHTNAVYFIDTDIDKNPEQFRAISQELYDPQPGERTLQEVTLGIGGLELLKLLRDLNHTTIHLNESNAAFVLPAMFDHYQDMEALKSHVMFTTHTPIEAGHKKYQIDSLQSFLSSAHLAYVTMFADSHGTLNLTHFCLTHSGRSNAVARRHQEVSNEMYPNNTIHNVTNGIHHMTWISDAYKSLFDTYLPQWKYQVDELRYAYKIPDHELRNAHTVNKNELLDYVEKHAGIKMNPNILTIGFSRRIIDYKRHDFIFRDITRLEKIAKKMGGIQIIFSGKAYPGTGGEKSTLQYLLQHLRDNHCEYVTAVFLENYSMDIGKLMVGGCDIWLNTPIKPREACGTSGMKAAMQGVPNFSTIDGWWYEGWIEDVTGWSIGNSVYSDENEELQTMYGTLENKILPLYYNDNKGWALMMKHSISVNGSYFTAQRMVREYYL